ncbi:MAG: YjbQ family protein [Deltaproteobacteria bacterium]|nr:YjbQ family protein [Deltaproteobacteria bacterium]
MNTLAIQTTARTELINITRLVQEEVDRLGLSDGAVMLYVPHTTAAVTINEAADPSVAQDILMVLNDMVPWKGHYRHLEGNSPAHVKAVLVGSSEMIPVAAGRLVLGTWQGVFFAEFDGPRPRQIYLQVLRS